MLDREREIVSDNRGIDHVLLTKNSTALPGYIAYRCWSGFTFCPPLSLGGIDLQQAGSALMVKNGSQRLIGTAVSGDPADNFAIIENVADGWQWIYREGDSGRDDAYQENPARPDYRRQRQRRGGGAAAAVADRAGAGGYRCYVVHGGGSKATARSNPERWPQG